MSIITYFSIALIVMFFDAMDCHILKKKYNHIGGFICAIFWPITAIVTLICVNKVITNKKEQK